MIFKHKKVYLQLAAQAIGAGAFGGGREGVQRAEYQSASDRNRASLQAQLLQQGFGQAQNLAQAKYCKSITIRWSATIILRSRCWSFIYIGWY
jgi:hypothetical protein